ncbi:MAG TPA: SRPBCC domain-containing protein, partial [Alphaproteobacteria bacterium]|nr:SRPBCC domain-containing protein [Alphaproteobacteria bacterium]
MSSAKIMVSIRLKVPPAAAFDLFTARIDDWWRRGPKYRMGPGGRLRFEPGEGGRLIETYDEGDLFEIGRILVWRPGERLVFEWRQPNFTADQVTEVDIGFVAVAEGTRLTLEHRGLDTLPAGHPARHGMEDRRFLLVHARWWDDQFAAFK